MKTVLYSPRVLAIVIVFAAMPAAFGQVIYPPGVSGPALLPDFDAATFASPTTIDNPYFPLVPRTLYTYRGQTQDDGAVITNRMFVTPNTRNILGVQTRVVRDTEWVDGQIAEDTFDWFAQDTAGNVWYFGEDTTAFEYDDEGVLIGTSTEGSWQAGVDGAQPGFIMLADPDVGDHYFQEFAPGVAEDEAVVAGLGLDITTGLGNFSDVLKIYETTALEPDQREFKYYAPGVGLVLTEEDLNEQLADPQFTMELVNIQVIPEPISLALVAVGLGGLARVRRRFR